MNEIYFCTPGELVVYLSSSDSSDWDGQLGRVLGIKKGKLELEFVGPHISKAHLRQMVTPKDIIDSAEASDEESESQEGDDDEEWTDGDMDNFLESMIRVANITPCSVQDTPCCDEIIWNSSNSRWRDIIAQGQLLAVNDDDHLALECFHTSQTMTQSRDEYLVSLLLTMQYANKLNNFDLFLQCFEKYSSNNPSDIHTQLQMYKAMWESPFVTEQTITKIETSLQHFLKTIPSSPSILCCFARFEKFRGNQDSAYEHIRNCCYRCPLQSVVETNVCIAIQTHVDIGWMAFEFLALDPWLATKSFIRALNLARNYGLDPCNLRTTRSNKAVQDQTLRGIVGKCLYDYALVSKLMSEHFKSLNRPNNCLSSAYSALSLCCDIAGDNQLYRQAKEECANAIFQR